ncbi:MAG TPA: hypothetical protein VKZ68_03070, partial [Ohtaekwangia sp.]|nr:hypothetical protein [Ohtaekwangia sp.]
LVPLIILVTMLLTVISVVIRPVAAFFQFTTLSFGQALIATTTGCAFVLWFEFVKVYQRSRRESMADTV